ncbi:MAG: RIP metalloprotease RseP, partial [Candidatus Acidiferrales bacterium]
IPGKEISVQFERNGKTLSAKIKIPQDLTDASNVLGFPKERVIVDAVDRGLPAAKAGLKTGDEIASVDGTPPADFAAVQNLIQNSPGKPVHLLVRRNGAEIPMTMTPVDTDPGDGGGKRWVVGYTHITETVRESYPFFAAAAQSWDRNVTMTRQILSVVGALVAGKMSIKSLAGPVGIVQMSTEAAKLGFAEYIIFMAFLSVDLGILNLLPIPILDGGHVLMLAIEGSLRRDLSIAVKERFVTVGLVFLLAVFGFVMYYDVVRLLPGH